MEEVVRRLVERDKLESYLQVALTPEAGRTPGGDCSPQGERIERAAAVLKAERWPLYMRLITPYFSDDPRPELVEVWRREASESVARKLALADHEEALDFLLSHL